MKFLTSIKEGGFFKTVKEGCPYLIGFANEVTIDQYGNNWHGIKAAFFYNCVTKELCINATCGCMDSSYAIKPNATDVRLLKEKLAEKKVIFNRKMKETYML